MEMQNVTALTIPEGTVRSIQDSTNRVIWGRLNYDTKYAGDTYQQTYSGKNLIDPTNLTYVYANSPSQISLSSLPTGIRMTNNGGASQGRFALFKSVDLTPYTGKVARMKATFGASGGLRLYRLASDGSSRVNMTYTTTSDTEISFTVPEELGTSPYLGYALDVINGSGTIVDFTNLIMTIDASVEPFEPYTGGIPAPNPDYPQPIQVVTGAQTVTLGDGVDSEAFPVSLGTIELCKIGTYQDYIYKSGDDWYVHKEFGKYVFDGSETIAYNSSNEGFTINPTNLSNYMPNHTTPPMVGLSTHFSVNSTTSTWTGDNRIGLSSTGTFWCKATSFANSKDDCLAWLSTNKPSVYYALATATDAQITDATLVGQLNAVHEWLTRYGYTSTVTGNLPIIIQQTNL